MLSWGYPVASQYYEGCIIMYKNIPRYLKSIHTFDVNAREFVPRMTHSDSGNGSSSSSEGEEDFFVFCEELMVPVEKKNPSEHTCVRCHNVFFIKNGNEYCASDDICVYHHGKLIKFRGVYSCCGGSIYSPGCCQLDKHVWNGYVHGYNGPYDDYVETRPAGVPTISVYALDCEMVYTAAGMEVARVTVVGIDGRLVYDVHVRPENEVVDYNTRYSGITAEHLESATKTLKDVQNDLLSFIFAETILIGHGLDNDLRVLKIVHYTVIDTSITFPHYNGLPYKRSLKSLVSCFLRRDIQMDSENGHDSMEDSKACIDLMLYRLYRDFSGVITFYGC